MKISEVIEKLKELQETHGDLDCVILADHPCAKESTYPADPAFEDGKIIL